VPVTVLVGNAGLQSFGSVTIRVSGGFTGQGTTSLEFADVDSVAMGQWSPAQTGDVQLTMSVEDGVGPAANDTASLVVHVLGWGQIQGLVLDQQSSVPLRATLKCYNQEFPSPDPTYIGFTDSLTGFYQIPVTEGNYRVVVDPQPPYTDREITDLQVIIGGVATANFSLNPAYVLLVDDDGGASYQQFYLTPLAQAGFDAYHWDVTTEGSPGTEMNLFSGVIWFTGNQLDGVLNGAEQAALADYLDGGGNLFLTGQNIAEGLAGQPFLADYLKSAFMDSNSGVFQVYGIPGDPVTSGLSLLLVGGTGANNQNSKDVVAALSPGTESMYYSGSSQPVAAVRVDSPYRLLFLACGLEGASGLAGTSTRQQVLEAVMAWFQIPSSVPGEVEPQLPPQYYGMLSLAPNPFNSGVRVTFSLAVKSKAEMLIFDALGRRVEILPLGVLQPGYQNVHYQFPAQISSGVYLFMLKTPSDRATVRGFLVK
jgi:hypothetical protein